MGERKLEIGTIGITQEQIEKGKWGWAMFPIGPPTPDGKPTWIRHKVYGLEELRDNKEIIVVKEGDQCIEHTPQELKYERAGVWQRVTEDYPLPVDGAKATPASVRATAAGTTEVQTPSSGKKLRIKYIEFFNSGAASVTVDLRFTTTGTARFKKNLAAQTGFNASLIGCNWRGGTDEALYINLSTKGVIDCTIFYQEE